MKRIAALPGDWIDLPSLDTAKDIVGLWETMQLVATTQDPSTYNLQNDDDHNNIKQKRLSELLFVLLLTIQG